jgi:RNA polymerase sigma factor (sigma-70 family)
VEGRPLDEGELVSRARRGDPAAFGALIVAHQEIAFRTAYLVLGDAAEAEDAAQEGFVKAHAALDRFRDGAPFRPWLLRIVVNTARNRRRSATRRMGLQLRVDAAEASRVVDSAESGALAAERRRELVDAVNGLGPDDRLIIGARYFLELHEAEIATLIGVAPGTVKSRLSRARARLARRLEGGAEAWLNA